MLENESPQQPMAGAGSANSLAGPAASKAATRQRLSRLKGRIMVTTLLGFGALSVLAAGHRVGTTTAPATTPPAVATPAPSTDDGGGSSDQGNNGGNGGYFNGGGSGDQGGYGFGNGGYAQPPVAGSGAS